MTFFLSFFLGGVWIYLLDQIPVFVTMSQKNNRNSSDETFLKDLPITFDVLIHDPSHFLNESAIYYKWNFGDNTGLFVSNNHTLNHTYVLNGTFSLNLTVQATVPGPCPSPSPRPPKTTASLGKISRSFLLSGFLNSQKKKFMWVV